MIESFISEQALAELEEQPPERRIEVLEDLERRLQAALGDDPSTDHPVDQEPGGAIPVEQEPGEPEA